MIILYLGNNYNNQNIGTLMIDSIKTPEVSNTTASNTPADKILQIGRDLSTAISAKSENPADVMNRIKTITESAKATIREFKTDVDNKHFYAVANKIDKLDKIFESDNLNNAEVKNTAKMASNLAIDLTKLAADIAMGNVAGIALDGAQAFKSAMTTIGMLKTAITKFDIYYKGHIKPVLKSMAAKAVVIEKNIAGDFKKAFQWIDNKVHQKHADVPPHTPHTSKEADTKTDTMAHVDIVKILATNILAEGSKAAPLNNSTTVPEPTSIVPPVDHLTDKNTLKDTISEMKIPANEHAALPIEHAPELLPEVMHT